MLINKLNELRSQSEEEGFTLIELMIVVVIIGILAAIAIPIFSNQQKAANAGTIKSDVRNTAGNIALALAQTPMASGFKGQAVGEAAPTLGAGEAAVKVVKSQGNSILISDIAPEGWDGNVSSLTGDGTWSGYQVTGYNSDFCWTFNSTTGKSDECVPAPSTGGTDETAGSGGTGGSTTPSAGYNASLASYSPQGTLTTSVYALDLAATPDGKVAMAGDTSRSVHLYNPATGTTTVLANTDEAGVAFGRIDGVVTDTSGNIYATAANVNKIYKISPTGTVTVAVSGIPTPGATKLEMDASGNFYVLQANAIWKITPAGVSTKISVGEIYATDIAVNASGDLYYMGAVPRGVFKLNADGTSTRFVDTEAIAGTTTNKMWQNLRFDSSGNLFGSSAGHGRIFKVTPAGTISTVVTMANVQYFVLASDGKIHAYNTGYRFQTFG